VKECVEMRDGEQFRCVSVGEESFFIFLVPRPRNKARDKIYVGLESTIDPADPGRARKQPHKPTSRNTPHESHA
jgi:hypothetical protein